MNKQRRWTSIRKNLSTTLNISPEILDFLSEYDILLACVSGTSNKDISKEFNIRESEVKKAIVKYIGIYCDFWEGFKESSPISPYFVLKTLMKSLRRVPSELEFVDEMERLTGDTSFLGESLKKVYQVVLLFSTVRYYYFSKYRKEDYGNYISRHLEEVTGL